MTSLKKLVIVLALIAPLSACSTARITNECLWIAPPHLLEPVALLDPLPDKPLTQSEVAKIMLARQARDKVLVLQIEQWQSWYAAMKKSGAGSVGTQPPTPAN